MSDCPSPDARRKVRGLVATVVVAALGLGLAVHASAPAQVGIDDTGYVLQATWPLPQAPSEPIDLAVLPGGRLYVADGRENAVLAYDASGAVVGRWDDPPTGPLPGHVYVPIGIAADPRRDQVYVLWHRFREDAGGLVPNGLFLDPRRPDGTSARPLQALTFMATATDLSVDRATGDLYFRTGDAVSRLTVPGGVPLSGFLVGPGAGRLSVGEDGSVAVTRPADGAVDRYSADGVALGRTVLAGLVPLDLAADDGAGWRVLVRAPVAADPGAALVVRLAASGAVMGTQLSADIVAPVPAAGAWPWALDWAAGAGALSTGSMRAQVHRFDALGAVGQVLSGGPVRPAFVPHGEDPSLIAASLALAEGPQGELDVLDAQAAQVIAFADDGTSDLVSSTPEYGVDLAVDAAGAIYVSTRDGRLARLSGDGSGTTVWDVACDCSLGGRLTVAPGTLYLTRPREQRVVGLDPRDGTVVRQMRVPDGVGMWPGDIVADTFGRLYTADLVTARVQVWTDPLIPDAVWQTGLLSGPRRLALGRLGDGSGILAAVMADGYVEIHGTGDGNMLGRWRPQLADGTQPDLSDIALGADGEVYVADARRRAVHVFAPGGSVPATAEPTPQVSPTPSDASCTVRGGKVAAPDTVVLGSTAAVTLTLAAECPERTRLVGADIVLVLDRSGSMQGAKLEAARGAARAFAELLDVRYHRLGLASFSTDASIDVPLTESVPDVIDGLARLQAEGGTNIAAALDRARANLDSFGRFDALPVIVLLSDGLNNEHQADPRPVALAARNWGAQIYTIGLGKDVDAAILVDIAGRPAGYFFAPTPSELFPIYGEILRVVVSSLAGNLVIDDVLGEAIRYVPGSARPLALESSGRLRWGRSILPSSGLTLNYRIRPEAAGCRATNLRAVADYTDADGVRRQYVFPVPTICVVTPTPTSTPTATPTRTPVPPTPTPAPVVLPMLLRQSCAPGKAHADVVLLVDISSSMTDTKLAAARGASKLLVGYLDLPSDQAAVIGFDAAPRVAVGLTGDRGAIVWAIDGLATGSGTRIDLALDSAAGELRSPRRHAGNRAVIVLLSDGGHSGARGDVVTAAGDARALGAVIFAVGLGTDADGALLEAVAGAAARYFYAPTERDLAAIYESIAVTIPCR